MAEFIGCGYRNAVGTVYWDHRFTNGFSVYSE